MSLWIDLLIVLGIYFFYFFYGLYQEKITKTKFGDEYYQFFWFLVLVQSTVNAVVARTICAVCNMKASLKPYHLFSSLAVTFQGAIIASSNSLAYVTYPTKVLGKSIKPIPILIFGVLIGGKRYSYTKYLIVLLIVMGVAVFSYKEDDSNDNSLFGYGESLIALALILDGLTGIVQEKLRDKNYSVSAHHQMYGMNTFAAMFLAFIVLVTGEIWRVTVFINRHPEVLKDIAIFSISSTFGQNFMFLAVTRFDPLNTSIITTTRKFFTILLSVFVYHNTLLARQWVGVVMVFAGLGFDAYYR